LPSSRGVPRQTVDVDATVWGDAVSIEALLDVFHRHHIVPRIADALTFARDRQVLLLRHLDSGTPIEVTFASLPFEREAIGRATRVDFGGVEVASPSPKIWSSTRPSPGATETGRTSNACCYSMARRSTSSVSVASSRNSPRRSTSLSG